MNKTNHRIRAITVNHNTSKFMELMLRSLYATHSPDLDMALTVLDNGSTDDTSGLLSFLAQKAIPLQPSGFPINTRVNSHGEALSKAILTQPDCDYYLLLDSDICFLQPNTIDTMRLELEADEHLFGVGIRQSWDGREEIPEEMRQMVYYRRLHPCCALIKNTPLFRRTVAEVGLTGLNYFWVEGDEYWDTCALMTKVMRIHGLEYKLCSTLIYHFFCVSYDPSYMEEKNKVCDRLLAELRSRP